MAVAVRSKDIDVRLLRPWRAIAVYIARFRSCDALV